MPTRGEIQVTKTKLRNSALPASEITENFDTITYAITEIINTDLKDLNNDTKLPLLKFIEIIDLDKAKANDFKRKLDEAETNIESQNEQINELKNKIQELEDKEINVVPNPENVQIINDNKQKIKTLQESVNTLAIEKAQLLEDYQKAQDLLQDATQKLNQSYQDIAKSNKPIKMTEKLEILSFVPEFKGDKNGISIKEFLQAIEKYATIGGWTEATKIKIAYANITGKADMKIQRDATLQNIQTWKDLKANLIEKFKKKVALPDAEFLFVTCKMRKNESVEDFACRVDSLSERTLKVSGDAIKDGDRRDQLEARKLIYFIQGLVPGLRQFVQGRDPKTYTDAIELAQKYEITYSNDTLDTEQALSLSESDEVDQKPERKATVAPKDQALELKDLLNKGFEKITAYVDAKMDQKAKDETVVKKSDDKIDPDDLAEALKAMKLYAMNEKRSKGNNYNEFPPNKNNAVQKWQNNESPGTNNGGSSPFNAYQEGMLAGLQLANQQSALRPFSSPQQRYPNRRDRRFGGNCYNCGKYGHRSRECRSPPKNPQAQNGGVPQNAQMPAITNFNEAMANMNRMMNGDANNQGNNGNTGNTGNLPAIGYYPLNLK